MDCKGLSKLDLDALYSTMTCIIIHANMTQGLVFYTCYYASQFTTDQVCIAC
jgi:hypothetical protein